MSTVNEWAGKVMSNSASAGIVRAVVMTAYGSHGVFSASKLAPLTVATVVNPAAVCSPSSVTCAGTSLDKLRFTTKTRSVLPSGASTLTTEHGMNFYGPVDSTGHPKTFYGPVSRNGAMGKEKERGIHPATRSAAL